MSEKLQTWCELASRAGTEAGDTPEDAPIERLMSAPVPLTSSGGSEAAGGFQGCGSGCACAPMH
jgi:hypothetical protein